VQPSNPPKHKNLIVIVGWRQQGPDALIRPQERALDRVKYILFMSYLLDQGSNHMVISASESISNYNLVLESL
jgi:hypothetical protein